MAFSSTFYSFDPCARLGLPCGACPPYSNNPCVASVNDLRRCSTCPGGGCSPCPAPVRPCPSPCPPCPCLPPLQPCSPCDPPIIPPPPPKPNIETVAIPCCLCPRCKPCPKYVCPEVRCREQRCSYPGVPVCSKCCGPVMPVW